MSIIYLDTETTGLDPAVHEVWEIAFAIGDRRVQSAVVPHSGVSADPDALAMNGYHDRGGRDRASATFDTEAVQALDGNTLCCANPGFDSSFLRARWGKAPWKYRLLDVEAYAMGLLGHETPKGLKVIAAELRDRGWDIPEPDHTATADVETLRECHWALQKEYEDMRRRGRQ